MRRRLPVAVCMLFLVCCAVGGCNALPAPPRQNWLEPVRFLDIPPGQEAERTLATSLEAARINYRFRLSVLQAYYERIGNLDKYKWAQRELKNLDSAQTFTWRGLHTVVAPAGQAVVGTDERRLVKDTLTARKDYKAAAEALAVLYEKQGKTFPAAMVRNMQERLDPVHLYQYFLDAEVPPSDLRPTRLVIEAEKIYAEARRLYQRGSFLPGLPDKRTLRKSLALFQKLVQEHPRSTRIPQAAFYIAEIYKEFFGEHIRAVAWYERAWTWDSRILLPARFQAAVQYDFFLHNKTKAVELYRAAIDHEQFNQNNVRYARQRIAELTGQPIE